MATDFRVWQDTSVTLVRPETEAAKDWCAEHLPDDCPRMGRAYAIENNYALPILNAIGAAGFEVGI